MKIQAQPRKATVAKFPLRLMPSVRKTAEAFSQKEGVSLNQFINIAVAEKLAHLEHDDWLRRRKTPSKQAIARALKVMDRAGSSKPVPGDELPAGYRSVRSPGAVNAAPKKKAPSRRRA